ncbi:phosphofructokinase 4 [Striga asiatica]|uniref:Phosphofructokinase 4 n=1 Tax=Striga asiatica TaxID=4170 RepID=A0A5A7PIK4_STRAF|nr:phosphofructokinase 4 [Striga asiatica]
MASPTRPVYETCCRVFLISEIACKGLVRLIVATTPEVLSILLYAWHHAPVEKALDKPFVTIEASKYFSTSCNSRSLSSFTKPSVSFQEAFHHICKKRSFLLKAAKVGKEVILYALLHRLLGWIFTSLHEVANVLYGISFFAEIFETHIGLVNRGNEYVSNGRIFRIDINHFYYFLVICDAQSKEENPYRDFGYVKVDRKYFVGSQDFLGFGG